MTPRDPTALNEEASVWMHRGIDLLGVGTLGALREALPCFDAAIALRRALPLGEVPFYRYGLSAGWINRADALAGLGDRPSLDEAVRSYGEALALLETLALEENPLYPRRLAITRLNLGAALQRREAPGDLHLAARCFRQSLEVLARFPAAAIADHRALQAAAWGNLAGALAGAGEGDGTDARAAARQALSLAPGDGTDAAAFETARAALAARHVLCRLLVRDLALPGGGPLPGDLVAEATDAVEEALASLRREPLRGRVDLERMGRELFRFGCRLYAAAQPRFLAEFLGEQLDQQLDPAGEGLPLDAETVSAARAAIWTAVDQLQAGGFGPLLGHVQELKRVEERLEPLGGGPAPVP